MQKPLYPNRSSNCLHKQRDSTSVTSCAAFQGSDSDSLVAGRKSRPNCSQRQKSQPCEPIIDRHRLTLRPRPHNAATKRHPQNSTHKTAPRKQHPQSAEVIQPSGGYILTTTCQTRTLLNGNYSLLSLLIEQWIRRGKLH